MRRPKCGRTSLGAFSRSPQKMPTSETSTDSSDTVSTSTVDRRRIDPASSIVSNDDFVPGLFRSLRRVVGRGTPHAMAVEAAAGGVSRRSDMETTFPIWDDAKVEDILAAEDGTWPPRLKGPL